MRITLTSVFNGAGSIWRQDGKLLTRLGGVLVFLPALAVGLFLPEMPKTEGMADKEAVDLWAAWIGANWGWLALHNVVQVAGTVAMLALLLDPRRLTAGESLGRMLVLLPAALLASVATALLSGAGLLLLLLPGFYVIGRTFLVLPVLAGEGKGGGAALIEGIRRTEGHGWMLAAAALLPLMAGHLAVGVIGGVESMVAAKYMRPEPLAVLDVLTALVATAVTLAQIILQVSAYRLLGSRHGI